MPKIVLGIYMKREEWIKLRKYEWAKKCFDKAVIKLPASFKQPNTWIKKETDTLEEWIQCLRNLKSNGIKHEIVHIKIFKQIQIDFDHE